MDEARTALIYHERTKHHPQRFARSPGYLDWKNQPNPFRFWEGTRIIELPLLKDPSNPYEALYDYRVPILGDFSINSLSKFLELALGLSAWKEVPGSRWAVRMNPSSGNLHPTEAYVILPGIAGLSGVYHYNPYLHALEERAELPQELSLALREHFGTEGFILILTTIPWREAWKYGERALRYCLLDAGHASGSVRLSASLRGWKVKYLNALSDSELETLLGFDRTRWYEGEEEFPLLAFFVFPRDVPDVPRDIPPHITRAFSRIPFFGKPNKLSKERVIWEIVYEALRALRKPKTNPVVYRYPDTPLLMLAPSPLSAEQAIRRRRSGMAYDPSYTMSAELFFHILDKTLPRSPFSPFDLELTPTYVNLFLFVHRVEGLVRGLYCLVRNEELLPLLRRELSPSFLWKRVSDALPLYLLAEGDFGSVAGALACGQEIASDSAFSLAMLSLFEPVVSERPWEYRHIHHEAGLTGQVLYVEASAHLIGATGIGCFFDDLTHELLGIKGRTLQDVYHFTVGKPVEDPRIRTLDPYFHLKKPRV